MSVNPVLTTHNALLLFLIYPLMAFCWEVAEEYGLDLFVMKYLTMVKENLAIYVHLHT